MVDRLSPRHLLNLARRLQSATDLHALVDVVAEEIGHSFGFGSTWLCVIDDERYVRLVASHGEGIAPAWERMPVLDTTGDPFLQECLTGEDVVVVEDARTDSRTNKELVAQLGFVTMVVVPLRLVDEPLGALVMGTFGDEGVKVPSAPQLDYLVQVASQLSVAAARIRFAQEREAHAIEREQLQERLRAAHHLRSLGMLAGGAAHDLNNMLMVILGSLSLAEEETLTKEQRALLTDARMATEHATVLAAELLSLSREREPQVRPLPVLRQLASFVRLLQRVLPGNIELRLLPVAANLWVRADAAQLNQVLMNLCVNARDAMPEGGVLTLAAEEVAPTSTAASGSAEDRRVGITVEDTGSGMAPDVKARIFEPLFSTKQERGGTGLGLSVVKRIVEEHGAELTCQSQPARGTVFTLSLPYVDPPAGNILPETATAKQQGPEDPSTAAMATRGARNAHSTTTCHA